MPDMEHRTKGTGSIIESRHRPVVTIEQLSPCCLVHVYEVSGQLSARYKLIFILIMGNIKSNSMSDAIAVGRDHILGVTLTAS